MQGWLDEARKKRDKPSELSPHLQEGIKKATGTQCPDLPKAFTKIGESNPSDFKYAQAKLIPAALEACKCAGVDPAFDLIIALASSSPLAHGWVPAPAKAVVAKHKTISQVASEMSSNYLFGK